MQRPHDLGVSRHRPAHGGVDVAALFELSHRMHVGAIAIQASVLGSQQWSWDCSEFSTGIHQEFHHDETGRPGRRGQRGNSGKRNGYLSMKPIRLLGILLIFLGVIALAYQGISYTTREKVLDIGPIEATKETRKTIPLPPILGGLAVAGGIALMVMGNKE